MTWKNTMKNLKERLEQKLESFLDGFRNILTAPLTEDVIPELSELTYIPSNLVYLASPYARMPEHNYNLTAKYVAERLKRGEVVISPIVMFHHIKQKFDLPTDTDWWIKRDYAILAACDEVRVLMLPGWQQSAGVEREIVLAKSLGKYLTYVSYEG